MNTSANVTDYVLVSMQALADIIDDLGGIDIAVSNSEIGRDQQAADLGRAGFHAQ